MKKLFSIAFISLLLLAASVDAQRSRRLVWPCSGSSTPAKVEVETDGDINLTPCATRTVSIPQNISIGTGQAGLQTTGTSSSLGDWQNNGNGTRLTVNDSTRSFIFNEDGAAAAIFELGEVSDYRMNRTITAGGTTGNRTINKPAGTVNIAAGASAVTVTNSLATASSLIFLTKRTNDATCDLDNVVAAAGSFVITMTANCTAETSVGFLLTN